MSLDSTNTTPPPYNRDDGGLQRSTEVHREYKIHKYGMFNVVFDPFSWLAPEGLCALYTFFVNLRDPIRFMTELFWLSPPAFLWFILCQALHPLMSTVHILTLYRAFNIVEKIIENRFENVQPELRMLWLCAALSVLCSLCCTIAFEQVLACRQCLGSLMRRKWIPIMVTASLLPKSGSEAVKRVSPYESEFALFIPGWDQLYDYTTQIRNVVEVMLHTLAFLCILFDTSNWILRATVGGTCLWLLHLQVYPSFWMRGYKFWSHHEGYRRLGNLFRTIFSQEYNGFFEKEGISTTVANEYTRLSERLFRSNADVDTWHLLGIDPTGPLLRCLPAFVQPMGFALLISYPSLAPSIIALMGTFPFALSIVSSGIDRFTVLPSGSNEKARASIQTFLKFLDDVRAPPALKERKTESPPEKFEIALASPSKPKSLDLSSPRHIIHSGDIVVVVSEKQGQQTSLLQAIAGMRKNEDLEVSISDIHLSTLDQDMFRKTIVYVDDSDDTLLPGTLRDNLLWTVNLLRAEAGMNPIELSASDYRFCTSLLEGLCEGNPNMVLKLEDCDVCVDTGFNYSAGQHAINARRQHERPAIKSWQISKEDRRLISITRAFLKAKYGPCTKLVILDDAASSFDALTERRIFEAFSAVASSSGQTLIYSTRRLRGIVEKAKQVMCLRTSDQDVIVCHSGEHETLYHSNSVYQAMYDSQPGLPPQ